MSLLVSVRRTLVPLAVLAVLAIALTLGVRHTLFAAGSPNEDEIDYRNQAAALAAGQLTLDAPTHLPAFRPYLTAVRDGQVVFTHQPPWAAVLAAADRVGVPEDVVLAALVLVNVAGLALLARELTGDRRAALIGTALAVLSPLFVMQSSTVLAYQFSLACAAACGGALLRWQRTKARAWAVVGGVAAGVLVFNRPFDAVLVLVPLAVFLAARRRGERRAEPSARRRATRASAAPLRSAAGPITLEAVDAEPTPRVGRRSWWAVVAGAAGPLALMLAYNERVMGTIARFPYMANEYDTIGFGPRTSFLSGPDPVPWFGPGEAARALGRNLEVVPVFVAGGLVTIALAVVGIRSMRARGHPRLVAALIAAGPLGYLFWWTTWNTTNFGLERTLGPSYYLVSCAVLAIAGGAGLARLLDTRRRTALVAGVSVVVWTVLASGVVVGQAQKATDGRRAVQAALETAPDNARIVFTPPGFDRDPYVKQVNQPDLGGTALHALTRGPEDLDVARSRPTRTPYRLALLHDLDGVFEPTHPVLIPLELVDGAAIDLDASFASPWGAGAVVAYVSIDRGEPIVAPPPTAGGRLTTHATVDGAGVRFGPFTVPLTTDRPHEVALGFAVRSGDDPLSGRFELRFPIAVDGARAHALLPPQTWHRYVFPNGQEAWAEEELGTLLLETHRAR